MYSIKLLQIYYRNIREMKEVTIDLYDKKYTEEPKHVSLIQMPNGIGKTTTMELIRYCLDGEAEKLDENKILSFRPSKSKIKDGEFRVKFSMDKNIIFVSLIFDYEKPSVKYQTTSSLIKHGGKNIGLHLPSEISAIMTRSFVRLFVFDGELAGELLKMNSSSAEEAINSLYHLDKIKQLCDKIDLLVKEKLDKSLESGVKTDQGKKGLHTKLTNIENYYNKLRMEKEKQNNKASFLRSNIQEKQEFIEDYLKKNEETDKKYDKLKEQYGIVNTQIEKISESLLSLIRFPNNLSEHINNMLMTLGEQMTKLKLPKTQSLEFFEELAQSDECICGRPLKDEQRKKIRLKAKEYLTEDNIGVINAIKTSIRNLPKRKKIEDLVEKLKQLQNNRKQIEQNISILEKSIEEEGRIKIDNLKSQKQKDAEELGRIDEILQALNEENSFEQRSLGLTWENNIPLCKEEYERLKKQLAEATNTVEFNKKAEMMKEILNEINERALLSLKKNILEKTNEKITKILKSDDIKILGISKNLLLDGRTGVSEGQKLSIAYAFLSTMLSQAPLKLPFIVDTPAAPLDLSVRRQVAESVPQLFDQTVIFITSGEREGFADRFYSKEESCLFLTVQKDKANQSVRIENSLDCFKKFQSED